MHLKGETTRQGPFAVTGDCIEIPQEISQLQNNVTVGVDFVFINGIVFHATASRGIEFCAIEDVANEFVQ